MIAFARPWFLTLLLLLPAVLFSLRRFPLRKTSDRRRAASKPAAADRGQSGPGRRRAALTLRAAGLVLLILAAAGPSIRVASDRVEAVFVVDQSDSLGPRGPESALALVNQMLAGMRGDDDAGLVTVAGSAALEAAPRPGGAAFAAAAKHEGSRSVLAEGIYTAAAALGGSGERRIVLVSDGRDSDAALGEAVRFARRSGIILDALPVGAGGGDDASVVQLRVPRRVAREEIHQLSVVINSSRETAARLVILRDGEFIGEDRQPLRAGESLRTYEMPGTATGTTVYEVILDAAADSIPENNRGLGAVRVEGLPRVLWAGRGNSAIPDALRNQGMPVDSIAPEDIPDRLEGFSPWDSLILDNVSARELSSSTISLLESWVRNFGGALMMVGGDASFGLGGWQSTPVERALPVSMDSPSSLYIPSLSMVIVIDKSGSMGSEVGSGFSKLDLVKDAVLSAVEVLNPLYTVGVVAFDGDFEWTVPMTEAGSEDRIRAGLGGLESGGGTVLYPAIHSAYERLLQSPAAVRHLVVLSDGLAEPAEYLELAEAAARDGITVSTVAVGRDADAELLEALARSGGGRYWYAEDATQVPRIFASESTIVSRGLVVEETIFPTPFTPAEALEGIDLQSTPPIHGYVMTSADSLAVEALRAPRGHPILAFGHHGLGRSVALTTDLRGSWGRDWTAWDQLPRLLSQSLRWMRRRSGESNAVLTMTEAGSAVRVSLEARHPDGTYSTGLRPAGAARLPDGRELAIPMTQTAPGRYEGEFPADLDGVYHLSAQDEEAGLREQGTWTRAYSPEYRSAGTDRAAMADAARIGGGRLLSGTEDPDQWWRVRTPRRRTLVSLTLLLGLLALVFILLDIFIREAGGVLRERGRGEGRSDPDLGGLVLRGLSEERTKGKGGRLSPAEAARILAERRARREG